MNNLDKAKASLILSQPFFASLLLKRPMVCDETIKTMATDGESILFNPKFVESLSVAELTFVLGHEVMHCAFLHMFRRGTKDFNRWNIATDYVINDLLVAEKVGIMPQGCLYNPALVKQGNGTAEGVYALLPDEPSKNPSPGENGGSLDELRDAKGDEAKQSELEAQTKVDVIQAANAAKMSGKLSKGLDRFVKQVTKSKTDWKSVLKRFLTEKSKTEYTFARPKRRFLSEDLYLASQTGEAMGEIVIAVDCSGSVNESMLNMFASELQAIKDDIKPSSIRVVYFDSEVLKVETYGPDDTLNLKPIGGGGTAFSPIFKHIDDNGLNPVAVVVLTDLCASDFGAHPSYPVLWATNGLEYAPFGEVLKINNNS